ncbi:MAG: diguanylate cyclase [Chloroflexota bacterium]|nr:MAG: diguanylate cyclase [Chloroflexota bacterium]
MDTGTSIIGQNMVLVFFVYGLAWFTAGVVILATLQRGLHLKLSASLPWLAAFSLTHAVVEWLDVLRLLPPDLMPLAAYPAFGTIKLALLALSLLLLLQFAVLLVGSLWGRARVLRWLPIVLLVLWLMSPLYAPLLVVPGAARLLGASPGARLDQQEAHLFTAGQRELYCLSCHARIPQQGVGHTLAASAPRATMEVSVRYMLYFPGLLLSAIGFALQGRLFRRRGLRWLARDAYCAAGVFAINSFFAGLVSAPGPFFPAAWLNYLNFTAAVGAPPQLFRAGLALASMFFIARILRVYRVEQDRRLAAAHEERLRTQERLSKELSKQVAELSSEMTELHSLGERIAYDTDSGRVLKGLMGVTARLVRADECMVYLRGDDGRLTPALVDQANPRAEGAVTIPDCVRRAAEGCTSVLVQHVLRDDGMPEGAETRACSILAVPLLSRGELLGVVSVQARSPRSFGDSDRFLLETIAGQAAVALHNAQLYARVSAQSIRDGLTGLHNHRYFQERAEAEISRCARTRRPLSLLFCDLDSFKSFNDANGHPLGDQALQDVAAIINASKRATDVAARYGGEEFVVILPDADVDAAVAIGERIRLQVSKHAFESRVGTAFSLTISIGVASFPRDGHSKAELVEKADWAMYEAKRRGGNETCAFVGGDHIERPREVAEWSELPDLGAVYALAAAVDARDHKTRRHSEVVAFYASTIAQTLGLTMQEITDVRVASLLHDVGKVGVPDEILNKNAPLTDEEWSVVREHPRLGAEILKSVRGLLRIISCVRHHHERYDGSGYPDGIAGTAIPLGARIIAVADAFDAMTSDRPYRLALSVEEAIAEIRANAGTQFDPQVVQSLAEVFGHNQDAVLV